MAEVWGWLITVLIITFAVSCINALAQNHKSWADQQQALLQRQPHGGGTTASTNDEHSEGRGKDKEQ